jgi:hypothetical protein
MEAAAAGMVAVGVGAAAGTVAVVGMEVAVGTVAADGMDAAAGDVAGTVDIGGEAGVVGGPDTAGVVIPTTLTIPIIPGVINPVRGGVSLTEGHRAAWPQPNRPPDFADVPLLEPA